MSKPILQISIEKLETEHEPYLISCRAPGIVAFDYMTAKNVTDAMQLTRDWLIEATGEYEKATNEIKALLEPAIKGGE